MDLHEDTEKNLITAVFDFPGVLKEDVQLHFQNGKLTVSAETKKSEEHVDTGFTLRERHLGKLSRTLQLPQGVQVCRCPGINVNWPYIVEQDEQIKATMENGILTVTFPKILPELLPKKIVISDV